MTLSIQNTQICVFLDYHSFRNYLDTSCCFQKLKLSSLNSIINIMQQKTNFCLAATQQTSTTKLSAFFKKILNTVRPLKVIETNFTSEAAVIVDLFALEGEKELKYDKRTVFLVSPQCVELCLNPQRSKHAYMRFSGLLWFQAFFWLMSVTFRNQD